MNWAACAAFGWDLYALKLACWSVQTGIQGSNAIHSFREEWIKYWQSLQPVHPWTHRRIS